VRDDTRADHASRQERIVLETPVTTFPEERTVFFEPPHYTPSEIDAVLTDGTHLPAVYQREGRRLGFDRSLPVGTLVLLHGIRGWVVGSPA
jgi:hypothetical protein